VPRASPLEVVVASSDSGLGSEAVVVEVVIAISISIVAEYSAVLRIEAI
jgi:hypothetical protein